MRALKTDNTETSPNTVVDTDQDHMATHGVEDDEILLVSCWFKLPIYAQDFQGLPLCVPRKKNGTYFFKSKHARSVSLPSRSHPLSLRVEEQLHRLVASEATSSSSAICHNLVGLVDLYDSLDDLLHLPLFQQAAAHERQWVEEVLDGSLRLLDVSGTTRDVFSRMKEDVQALQSTFRRRRGGESNMVNAVETYISTRKQMNRNISKCLQDLKKMENKCAISTLLDKDHDVDVVAVARVVREVKAITVSILNSSLTFVSGSNKATSWSSLLSKLKQSKRVACEGEEAKVNELEKVDVALKALIGQKSCKGIEVTQIQEGLHGLEGSINNVEERLESMFKRLVKFRVSILNSLHH